MSSFSDIQNFNRLFNEYYERFIRFALSYVKEQQIAEDFVTEAFTSYWEKKGINFHVTANHRLTF